ncbi:hypothetical protein C8Q75DRAFT_730926 [Abortiporus biennis]|nr:hypothetical protein C8Q75DRAFT_730926 [Abortiporus biennis]
MVGIFILTRTFAISAAIFGAAPLAAAAPVLKRTIGFCGRYCLLADPEPNASGSTIVQPTSSDIAGFNQPVTQVLPQVSPTSVVDAVPTSQPTPVSPILEIIKLIAAALNPSQEPDSTPTAALVNIPSPSTFVATPTPTSIISIPIATSPIAIEIIEVPPVAEPIAESSTPLDSLLEDPSLPDLVRREDENILQKLVSEGELQESSRLAPIAQ